MRISTAGGKPVRRNKSWKRKRVQLGPHIKFDGESCILCSPLHSGFQMKLQRRINLHLCSAETKLQLQHFPGESFDNPYTLNTTDICPVGILQIKILDLNPAYGKCLRQILFVSDVHADAIRKFGFRNNEILRLTPRHNEDVNSYWMCDKGRLENILKCKRRKSY